MSRLKFRAWDKSKQKMYTTSELIIWDNKVYANDIRDLTHEILNGWEIEEDYLMQSTGILDNNGVEIFEGDIIRTSAYGYIVGFGEYTYFEDDDTQTTEIGFYLSFLNVTPATYAPFDKYYWDNCEVIGNIYENELDLIMYEVYKYNKKTSEDKE